MSNGNAPVALFVYNRPWHTRRAVEALLANAEAPETPLYIFSDAPKDAAASKLAAEVRGYIASITGFKSVSIIERDHNFGLASSIIDGVTRMCLEHGRVIVLEDDLVVSRYFLKFMNDGLRFYENDDRVISISGYAYPIQEGLPETFFLRGADCWGWATWKRGWDLFEEDGRKLLEQLAGKGLLDRFDLFGAYGYSQMLRDQIKGKNSSWAVRWYASALLADKLTLYPGQSLVFNIGADGSGTHCGVDSSLDVILCDRQVQIGSAEVTENLLVLDQLHHFLKKIGNPGWIARIARRIGRIKKPAAR